MVRVMCEEKEFHCRSCGAKVRGQGKYHAGFNDTGFLYCDKDSTVLTFSSYDPTYDRLLASIYSGSVPHPWGIIEKGDKDALRIIEEHLIRCPCGGRFSFKNPLRCPVCGGAFSGPLSETIYFIVLERVIDGDKVNVWKDVSQ